MIAVYIVGHKAGYYLVERFHARLVLYFTAQLAIPTIDNAIGMPHHPALLPFGPTHFPQKMNFEQRIVNFLALKYAEHHFRFLILYCFVEEEKIISVLDILGFLVSLKPFLTSTVLELRGPPCLI